MSIQQYPFRHGKSWTHDAGKKALLVLFILFTFVFSTSALATVTKEVHFEWQFDTSFVDLAGYKIFKDGLHLVTISDPTTLSFDHTVDFAEGSTAVFTMRAFDIYGKESEFSPPYSIYVPTGEPGGNTPPTPRINVSEPEGVAPHVVEFSAAESTDSDGTISSYAWDFGDGDTATTAITNHTYTAAGTFTATLTITDNDGGAATAHTTITISSPVQNTPPTAFFTPTPTSGAVPLAVAFNGTASTDNDGTIMSYSWNFGDGNSDAGANVSHIFSVVGSFTVELTVTDDTGSQASYQTVITVTTTDSAPVASFSATPRDPAVAETIQFSGAASTAPAGNVVDYLWDFGDGKSASGVTPSHVYDVPGTYTVTLTVKDNYNTSSQVSVPLTILSLEDRDKQRLAIEAVMISIRLLLLDE